MSRYWDPILCYAYIVHSDLGTLIISVQQHPATHLVHEDDGHLPHLLPHGSLPRGSPPHLHGHSQDVRLTFICAETIQEDAARVLSN